MDRPSSQPQQNGQSSAQGQRTFHFLPLNSDLHSFPGAHLQAPALLQTSRSSTDLASPRSRWQRAPASISAAEFLPMRRKSSSGEPDDKHGPAAASWGGGEDAANIRRMSHAASVLNTPQVRSQRLIGYSNPRYRWDRYWKSEEELKPMAKKLRKYYERNNYLIQHYMYIDRLLDSSLPHDLIQEYQLRETSAVSKLRQENLPETIEEERNGHGHGHGNGYSNSHSNSHRNGNGNGMRNSQTDLQRVYPERHGSFDSIDADGGFWANGNVESQPPPPKVKRTPKDIYSFKASANNSEEALSDEGDEREPLLSGRQTRGDVEEGPSPGIPELEYEEEASSQSRIVTVAIVINVVANTALLIMKLVVVLLSSSVSVLASLVDAALDFLSTVIVGITTRLISRTDQYAFPIGRRRLEPVGVLVFSVIMITAFIQVLWEAISALTNGNHEIVQLTIPAIVIMSATVVIKGACWFWCRMIKNSSVQALAQDAATDVVFNTFSIIFPLIGYYAQIWWLDPLGGVFLSLYVIVNWSRTANEHIMNLTGASASADERNILLYLTMRFAKTIKQIQGLQAYHSGDKLNVEVDIVLEETISLRDSHDLGESLQYVIESVPNVDRAFVHMDYTGYNLPTHLQQDS